MTDWKKWRQVGLPLVFLSMEIGWFSFVFFRHQILNDDVPAYLFAAETFALGKVKVPIPEPDHPSIRKNPDDPSFFLTWMVVPSTFEDRDLKGEKFTDMYSRYPPGHPLLLFLGKKFLGDFQRVPLVLMLLTAVGIFSVLRVTEGWKVAVGGLWLLSLSPFLVVYGSSLLPHASTLCCLAWAMTAYVMMNRSASGRGRVGWGFGAGLFFMLALACRPLTGAAFILSVMAREIYRFRAMTHVFPRWCGMLGGGGLILAGLLWYNAATTGSPSQFAFNQYWSRDTLGFTGWSEVSLEGDSRVNPEKFKGEDPLGFSDRRYMQHTPGNGWKNAVMALVRFNETFLVIPCGLLLLAALLWLDRKAEVPYRRFYLFQMAAVFAAQFFYFAHGSMAWGPRYYYECLLPSILLLAPRIPGLMEQLRFWGEWIRSKSSLSPSLAGGVLVLLLLVVSADHMGRAYYAGWDRQGAAHEWRELINKNLKAAVRPPAIVFLPPQVGDRARYVGHPEATLLNSPDFKGDILYAIHHGSRNGVLTRRHPGRNLYEMTIHGELLERKHSDYEINERESR